jgi:transposase-like protein
MWDLLEREKAINMYLCTGKGYKVIAKELGVPRDTVRSWIRRYRKASGDTGNSVLPVKIERAYKPRQKPLDKSDQDRIATLEMEVELLRNFLLERERRLIKP